MDAAPLNYFLHAEGPAAQLVMRLGWEFCGVAVAVIVIIIVLLVWAIFRRRGEAILAEGAGLGWVYAGSALSALVLLVLTIHMLTVLYEIRKAPSDVSMTITVTGYDWWWKVDYDNPDPARRFITANEIHIPVGRPVYINLNSADVIHAFWVPQLAGKTQMIPGQTNHQWIEADRPGIYRGQCTQYCGLQHAHMLLDVVAESPEDYRRWEEQQLRPATRSASAGEALFVDRCGGCHAVRGTGASGIHAPDLTHLCSRRRIAGGLMLNTPDNLMQWILHAQELKPGSRMPDMALSSADQSVLADYLSTLR
ncbi:MAG: cytochrome c oxidase subunit II [Pseudomonadota bacterium]|nr:cytochrome c oxidase subunit II [Pseudomonadota bacterium]